MVQTKRIALFLTNHSEEIEVVVTVDVLRRADFHVDLVSVDTDGSKLVKCSRGVNITADYNNDAGSDSALDIASSSNSHDAIIIPGGQPGATTLSNNQQLLEHIKRFKSEGKLVALICAAPIVLKAAGLANSKPQGKLSITSHPSVKNQLDADFDYKEDRVVVDENVVTSRGPGTSFEFALKVVEILGGKQLADSVGKPMILSA